MFSCKQGCHLQPDRTTVGDENQNLSRSISRIQQVLFNKLNSKQLSVNAAAKNGYILNEFTEKTVLSRQEARDMSVQDGHVVNSFDGAA